MLLQRGIVHREPATAKTRATPAAHAVQHRRPQLTKALHSHVPLPQASWDFPLSAACKVMPSSQFFAFASIKRNLALPFLNSASVDLPNELCGVGYNFATMPPPTADNFTVRVMH